MVVKSVETQSFAAVPAIEKKTYSTAAEELVSKYFVEFENWKKMLVILTMVVV